MWWIWGIVLGSICFLFTVLFVLPKLFLQVRYFVSCNADRGILKKEEIEKKHYVYTPIGKTAKYVHSYYLQQRKDALFFRCRIDDSITFLDYNVVLFNKRNHIFRVINICENIKDSGFTEEINLPPETAYVAVRINSADGKAVEDSIIRMPKARLVMFSVFSTLAMFCEVIWVRTCLAVYYNDIYSRSFLLSTPNILYEVFISIACIALYLVATFLLLFRKLKTIRRGEG